MTSDPASEGLATHLGHNTYLIDAQIGGQPRTTGCYVIMGDKPALIETGPSTSAPRLQAALDLLGVGPDELATIVVTHIHLDHAGAVGDLAKAFPAAQVLVHPRGARHLIDPTRLMNSAERVYGPTLDRLFGRLVPTPNERVTAVEDGHRLQIGNDRTVLLRHAPGHALHHLVLLDEATGDLYTGDAAGMFVPETATHKPTTPPPEFDFAETMRSIGLFRSMRPTRLLFTHYGPGLSAEDDLEAAEAEIRFWLDQVRAARAQGATPQQLLALVGQATDRRYRTLTESPYHQKWEALSSTQANVDGIVRWLETTEGRQ